MPHSIYGLCEMVRGECDAAEQAPSRSGTNGLRSDTFGGVTCTDHCQVPLGTGEHISVVLLDGATILLISEALNTKQELENTTVLRNYFD